MDPTDDKVNFRGKPPRESSRPIRLGGSVLGPPRHICAFFNSRDDEYRVLLPFIKDGLEVGEKVVKDDPFGAVESVKAVSDVYAPVAGEVTGANTEVVDAPEKVNADAYAHWLYKLKPATAADVGKLLDAAAYTKVIGEA